MRHDKQDLWQARILPSGTILELKAGDKPELVLVQGENQVKVELTYIKVVVAALVDAAANLARVLAEGGIYHT